VKKAGVPSVEVRDAPQGGKMSVPEQIREKVKLLPEPTQYQVLDFVDYLLHRSRQKDLLWSKLSIRWAARGLEDEEWPEYTAQDIKETWE
jgi:hypothetical protein